MGLYHDQIERNRGKWNSLTQSQKDATVKARNTRAHARNQARKAERRRVAELRQAGKRPPAISGSAALCRKLKIGIEAN